MGTFYTGEHLFLFRPEAPLHSQPMPRALVDTADARKARGAFFTPPEIADFLARFAIRDPAARVLDPTSGEAVFLLAAGERLRRLKTRPDQIAEQLTGVDLHAPSLDASRDLLASRGFGAKLIQSDFFDLDTPAQMHDLVGWQDAVIGNPPFVRYQEHAGLVRKKSAARALAQGVRLSGLASSWAATLVHASGFLKPTGRLALVLPAELLTVQYAEPIRTFLRERFGAVNLFMFERLQFRDAEEQVVLLVAHGQGPCDSFCVAQVDDATDLADLHPGDPIGRNPSSEKKWSELALTVDEARLYRRVKSLMSPLGQYGQPELGTVTGRNEFFALTDKTRRDCKLKDMHLKRISPPGTRHLSGLTFSRAQWEELRVTGARVWLLHPEADADDDALRRYLERGKDEGVPNAYKCTVREPWWRPPAVSPPDLFFTYMSHRYPRLIANTSGATLLNSMHGIRLRDAAPKIARDALPLLALNSATMLGAEVEGRAYGGGILKMEPREAAALPVPTPDYLRNAWKLLGDRRSELDAALRRGDWWKVVAEVDDVLLRKVMKLPAEDVTQIREAASVMRVRRTRQTEERG
jgi:adenine-specific DNA-methyltransferase